MYILEKLLFPHVRKGKSRSRFSTVSLEYMINPLKYGGALYAYNTHPPPALRRKFVAASSKQSYNKDKLS